MAYRRKPGPSRSSSTLEEEIRNPLPPPPSVDDGSGGYSPSPSLAAKAIRASSAYKDSSLSSAYGHSSLSPASHDSHPIRSSSLNFKDRNQFEYTSMKNIDERQGLWSVLARKAKSVLEDDNVAREFESSRLHMHDTTTGGKNQYPYYSRENHRKIDNPKFQKGLSAITSSLNYIGGTIGNAVEEGLTIVESKTADIIQETRKHIRKKPAGAQEQNQDTTRNSTVHQPQMQFRRQSDQEIQLKASRDVAMAMAAKAKLLLRELKTVKADLAFAKERCAQLEEENKMFRESHEIGNPEDDDLIRLQLETLLAEKARLALENSVYARENRFLREIVEYHQLTMQDVIYLDENTEEVSEVYPMNAVSVSRSLSFPTIPISPLPSSLPHEMVSNVSPQLARVISPQMFTEVYEDTNPPTLHLPLQ